MIASGEKQVIANYLVDYWRQMERQRKKATGSFVRQVVEPTLTAAKLSAAEAAEWRLKFSHLNLTTEEGLNAAKSTVAGFMDRIQDVSGMEQGLFNFAKILAHGHWLDEYADHEDLGSFSENIVWLK
jgi:hypothetical protein